MAWPSGISAVHSRLLASVAHKAILITTVPVQPDHQMVGDWCLFSPCSWWSSGMGYVCCLKVDNLGAALLGAALEAPIDGQSGHQCALEEALAALA